ncbi:DUF547 domain-containing protein [Cyanobium sp. CH-040]|uniref:DUF547 domain-containing protein n=1 Tax=Cyanobium sp. CH-040 TaxID=2823708 RepID=UPI0020CED267|nr:DUF547 domain-containing protein [Cyanobium sp. CH-040]MCP9927734.1 DUF547 domain-containing protein [Cyanobium sp. CH-040]
MLPARHRSLLVLICGVLLLGAAGCNRGPEALLARITSATPAATQAPQPPLDPADFNAVLERVVDDGGMVDYEALQRDPARLDRYLQTLADLPPERFASWSEAEQIALLINAYNALTLRSIIDHDPIRPSIKAIPGVWKLRRHPLMGQRLTLDGIEHQILRKEYNEPRIHAALVCAAISCPPLRREAYTGAELERQLEDQTKRWLASPVGLRIDPAAGEVAISQIFQWFGEDWPRANPDATPVPGHEKDSAVLQFIARHRPAGERQLLLGGGYRLSYLPYNWDLNRQSR